jgi:RNA-binding protein YhbY
MKKFWNWLKEFYAWVLGGLSFVLITILLVFIKVTGYQKDKLKKENAANKAKANLGKNAVASGVVKGREQILAEKEAAAIAAVAVTTEEINEAEKPKSRTSSEVADILNTAYGRKRD